MIAIPLPRTRKGMKILLLVLMAICLALSAIVFFSWLSDQNKLKETGQPSFNTLDVSGLKAGMIVKGYIDLSFDTYAEEYKAQLGIRTSDKSEALYYLVPIYDKEDDHINIKYFITYEAEPKDYDTMDTIVKETFSDSEVTTKLTVENAVIRSMPDDVKQYLIKWAEDPNFYENGSFVDWCVEYNIFGTSDKAAIESKLVPYIIYRTVTAGTDLSVIYLFLGIGVICLIIFIILSVYKVPIKGVVDPPEKDDFNKIRENIEQ